MGPVLVSAMHAETSSKNKAGAYACTVPPSISPCLINKQPPPYTHTYPAFGMHGASVNISLHTNLAHIHLRHIRPVRLVAGLGLVRH